MRNDARLVSFSESIPMQVSIIEFDKMQDHMHSYSEIILILRGNAEIKVKEEIFKAKENDILIINKGETHSLESKKSTMILSALIDIDKFVGEEYKENILFNLNSITNENKARIENIRYLIYSIIRLLSQDNVNSSYNAKAIAYSLFASLLNDFKVEITGAKRKTNEYDTITKITEYINENYKEHLTLSSISKKYNYTESYISKLFKKSLNETFISYYDKIRVNQSIDELTYTKASIEDIAIKYGFENSRSYVRAFTSIYNTYPSEYRRKENSKSLLESKESSVLKKEAMDIVTGNYLKHIEKNKINELTRATEEIVDIDFNEENKKIGNPNNFILDFGNVNYLYNSTIIEELKHIEQEIKFEFIKIKELFNERSLLYREDSLGHVTLNKALIDNFLKVIYELKMKPYFYLKYQTGLFADNIVESFIKYIMENNNYTFDNIMVSINFEETNDYALEEKYTYYYKIIQTYKTLKKKYGKRIIFVSPSINDLTEYKILCQSNKEYGNIIDFISINYLNASLIEGATKNKHALKDFIEEMNRIYPINKVDLIIENVNFTNRPVSLLNDTLFKSSYQCKNVIDIYDKVKAINMNMMFDMTINNFFDNNPYLGLNAYYTFNNIKKSSYNALLLLSKLKSNVIKIGKNYIVTEDQNKIAILINNYTHYSDLFQENEEYDLTEEDRYKCFSKSTNIHFHFNISNLDFKNAKIKKTILSKESGSSYDIYKEIRGNSSLSNDDLNSVKNLSIPKFRLNQEEIASKTLSIDATIEPLETELIEITLHK